MKIGKAIYWRAYLAAGEETISRFLKVVGVTECKIEKVFDNFDTGKEKEMIFLISGGQDSIELLRMKLNTLDEPGIKRYFWASNP